MGFIRVREADETSRRGIIDPGVGYEKGVFTWTLLLRLVSQNRRGFSGFPELAGGGRESVYFGENS